MSDTRCPKTAVRVQGREAERNYEILRLSNLNHHSFTNYYSIHKPFMWGMYHMYISLMTDRCARAQRPLTNFRVKCFFRKISNVWLAPVYFCEFWSLFNFLWKLSNFPQNSIMKPLGLSKCQTDSQKITFTKNEYANWLFWWKKQKKWKIVWVQIRWFCSWNTSFFTF